MAEGNALTRWRGREVDEGLGSGSARDLAQGEMSKLSPTTGAMGMDSAWAHCQR